MLEPQMMQHLLWTFLLLFACGSCMVGVRKDSFWWGMVAGVCAIALALNGFHELGNLMDVMEGLDRPIMLTAETAGAGLVWIFRTGRWLHG